MSILHTLHPDLPVSASYATLAVMLETATKAAQAAGEVLLRYFQMPDIERVTKGDLSFSTAADLEAEKVVEEIIMSAQPDHGFLGEEGTLKNPDSEYQWIVDPLDGTSNFVSGIPLFAASIALVKNNMPVIGVVNAPAINEFFVAEVGKGATCNGKPIHVSKEQASTGIVLFGIGHEKEDHRRAHKIFSEAKNYFRSARLFGCASLDLAHVARGAAEGYVMCTGVSPWDYAAGNLLITEAGGKVSDYDGKSCDLTCSHFIATNGVTHDEFLKLVHLG